MTVTLLDGNVLVALSIADHVHHQAAINWFASSTERFATCPITQGTLLRLLVREGLPSIDALEVLDKLTCHDRHEFWPADRPFVKRTLKGVIGHRQITDAYLADMARSHKELVATFDAGLVATHKDVGCLIPT